METYTNKFHSGHLYVRIDESEAESIPARSFDELIAEHGKPLQAMIPSDAEKTARLLKNAGFTLKRRCFELDVGEDDLLRPLTKNCLRLEKAKCGEPLYYKCAELMYRYYTDTHAAVNPLTASREEFFAMLPENAVCAGHAAAFVEGNEIAYICRGSAEGFGEFASALIAYMLRRYDRIAFEADDTDPAAMELKALFKKDEEISFDTYIRDAEVNVRRACAGDEAALAHIQIESWKTAFSDILNAETLSRLTEIGKAADMYRTLIENDIGKGYMLTLNGSPHCIAWWDAARDAELDGKAELICIHSLRERRRMGYGRIMLERVLRDMRAAGYKEAVLWVFTRNAPAIAFYEAMGFHPTERIKPALGTEEICFEKRL